MESWRNASLLVWVDRRQFLCQYILIFVLPAACSSASPRLRIPSKLEDDSTSLSSFFLLQFTFVPPFLSPHIMPHPNNIPPSPPSPRSKLFAGLFLYQGGLPFSPLADLARMNPRPLILYGLEGNALVVNVVEGGREEKERLRGRLWAGLSFFLALWPRLYPFE